MIFAGSETTAMMLGWTWLLLLGDSQVEDKFCAEVDAVLAGRDAAFDDVARLEYTRLVIEESLRVRPPVWAIFRRATNEAMLGGYRITAGATIIVSPFAMHRNPRFWDDPERFDPERFAAKKQSTRPRYSYIPFGGGRHICIGNFLATMEGQLVMATVAQHFRMRLVPGHRTDLQPLVTLRPQNGVMVYLEPR